MVRVSEQRAGPTRLECGGDSWRKRDHCLRQGSRNSIHTSCRSCRPAETQFGTYRNDEGRGVPRGRNLLRVAVVDSGGVGVSGDLPKRRERLVCAASHRYHYLSSRNLSLWGGVYPLRGCHCAALSSGDVLLSRTVYRQAADHSLSSRDPSMAWKVCT
jgi:hypothetical protein